jgi:predicted DNA-binding transcriptional regulator AlpA
MTGPRKVISVARAAELTDIAEATWYAWAAKGREGVPQSFKLAGRRVLFEDEGPRHRSGP